MTINVFGGGYNPLAPVFPVQRSVRLRSSASAYFNRTPATSGNRQIFTISFWFKRGTIGGADLFTGNAGNGFLASFRSDNTLYLYDFGAGVNGFQIYSARVFRDPSAWYHLVIAVDTTQATDSNRIKVYINGAQENLATWTVGAGASRYPSLNANFDWNNTNSHEIGFAPATNGYFDGYLTEFNNVSGFQLDATSFGSYNAGSGVWQPIRYSGTYGTNGFYLNFQDNSAATAAAIGKDSSGNGNNWTPNNISVTAGVTYDSMLDVPTLTSATNANFATLNPLSQSTGGSAVPSNGNLTLSQATNNIQVASTIGMSAGKWYYEHTITALGGENSVGIGPSTAAAAAGTTTGQYGYYFNGNKYISGAISAYGAAYTTGDVIGVAYDADTGSLTFYKNGTSQGVATTGITGTMFALAATRSAGGQNSSNLNFGQRPFTYTPPTGYLSLNTYNLPAPTIPNGAAQFAATTYSGNGSTQSITNTVNGKSFQPDFVWVKSRSSGTQSHELFDSVRGVSKPLNSSNTNAEVTYAGQSLTAFNSNGFTVVDDAAGNLWVNGSTGSPTYIGWQWKAGGTAVTNTSGSITSSVSANPSAGFSIVTYTGTGANATVGHGLGIAPKMIIMKARSTASQNWIVYQASMDATPQNYVMGLNLTVAKSLDSTMLNNTAPTSSVWTIGTNTSVNNSGTTYVAYCFSEIAGYSKFGSYTGNGSADGPFVYCGFRPRWVMVKSTGVNGWVILDTSRSTYNLALAQLIPNLSNAEDTTNDYFRCDILSNGFKLRTTGTPSNANGVSFIYAAFAENPFSYSLAR